MMDEFEKKRDEVQRQKKAHMQKHIYSFYDVEMQMWTEPIVLRNDTEAKKLYKALLEKNQFNDCPVEMYCIGGFLVDSHSSVGPICAYIPRRIYVEDTIDEVKDE